MVHGHQGTEEECVYRLKPPQSELHASQQSLHRQQKGWTVYHWYESSAATDADEKPRVWQNPLRFHNRCAEQKLLVYFNQVEGKWNGRWERWVEEM